MLRPRLIHLLGSRIVRSYASKGGFEKFYKKGKKGDVKPTSSGESGQVRDEPRSEEKRDEGRSAEKPEDKNEQSDEKTSKSNESTSSRPKEQPGTAKERESQEKRDQQKGPTKHTLGKIEIKKQPVRDRDDKEENEQDPDDEEDPAKKKQRHLRGMLLAVSAFGVLYLYLRQKDVREEKMSGSEVDWDALRKMLSNSEIARIRIYNNTIALVESTGFPLPSGIRFAISSGPLFERQLEQLELELGISTDHFVPVTYAHNRSLGLGDLFISCLPALFFLWLFRNAASGLPGGGNPFNNKKKFTFTAAKKITTTFKDVAGLAEAKKEIEELVDFLKDPKKYEVLGAKIPKGCLLVGPPGVGKTLLARATAGEAKVPFLSISGSDFVEIFVGVGPSRVRDMFKEARRVAPAIIFIDEIDAIGRSRRGGKGGGNDERESTLNALLVEMDGFNTKSGVVVLAGTNRPDILDKALLRPGRFDRQIALEQPPLNDRIEIYQVHLKPLSVDPTTTKEELAKHLATLSAGFSGADIMNCCNEAALIAAREKAEFITSAHFEKAIDRIVGGLEKKARVLTKWEKRVVAYHEAGHAIVGWFMEHVDPLLKVSIQSRADGTLGYAHYLPKDRYIKTFKELMDEMCTTLGGTAAEKLVFQHKSTGAADDLSRVTRLAYKQVTLFGMSDSIGHVSFPQNEEEEFVVQKPYSHLTEKKIDEAVRGIVDQAYTRTERLLWEKRDKLKELAELLVVKEVLRMDDLVGVLGPRPFGMPEIYHPTQKAQKDDTKDSKGDGGPGLPTGAHPAPA